MTAAYGHFENTGGQPVRITDWSSDAYGEVSLHETVIDDGVSKMRERSDVEIAPDSSLSLEPGGLHLMLSDPALLVLPGETVRLTVVASDETRFEFEVPVEAR